MTEQPMSERRLVALSEEELWWLREVVKRAAPGEGYEPLKAIADRYEEGLTEEEAKRLTTATLGYADGLGNAPPNDAARTGRRKLRAFTEKHDG